MFRLREPIILGEPILDVEGRRPGVVEQIGKGLYPTVDVDGLS